MKVQVFNNGQKVWSGTDIEFLSDNCYDEFVLEMLKETEKKGFAEYELYHSGTWMIAKI